MKKARVSRIAAAVGLFLLQPAFIILVTVKAVIHFFYIFWDPAVRRKDVFLNLVKGLVLIALVTFFIFGWRAYNKLIDMEHFVHVAHGRLLAEMKRKQDLVTGCRSAVSQYAAMEEKLQERLIALHRLTKTQGRQAPIVQNEGLEIMKLIQGLDLLVEKYPGLKAQGPFGLLMETLQETGFKVITERLNFNDRTYDYNVLRVLFPYKLIAWMCGFKEQPFLVGPLDYTSMKNL